jgi:uncharacterized SAM-binding protein YcdF (DUF218 family)
LAKDADAIVVLGCRVGPGGSPSAALIRRVDRGVGLFHEGAAPLLVLSGGGAGPVAEAAIMREMALGWGVPEAAVVIESFSHNTLENARETARLLGLRGLRSVLLVSNRTHLPRAILLFRFAGLDVVGWAAAMPPSSTWAARSPSTNALRSRQAFCSWHSALVPAGFGGDKRRLADAGGMVFTIKSADLTVC